MAKNMKQAQYVYILKDLYLTRSIILYVLSSLLFTILSKALNLIGSVPFTFAILFNISMAFYVSFS